MLELLITLTTISLLDSMSAVPIALIPLAIILNSQRPVTGSLSFISGGFIVYFIFGIFILLGMDSLINEYSDRFMLYIRSEPDRIELMIQIFLGVLMMFLGWHFSRKSPYQKEDKKYKSDMGPLQIFTLSASINILGMWGALPYFAAMAQILKADLETPTMMAVLIYYNVIFSLPLLGFIMLRVLMGDRASATLDRITRFFSHWGKLILILSLYLLGLLLIADGIGWFIGYPILDFTE